MTNAVITGLGVLAPNGVGVEGYWAATLAGRSAIGPLTRFDPSSYPVSLAGEVRSFAADRYVPSRLIVQTDHCTHMALAAAEMALVDAAVVPGELPEYEMAVATASSSGGAEFGQREIEALWRKGPRFVGAYQSIAWFYAATSGQISIRHGMRGPCSVVVTEQSGGLDALGQARRLLDRGARLVVSGGTDASLCPYGLVAQLGNGRLSQRDDPARAYIPFDEEACGHVPGEGGAILVVEDADHAAARPAAQVYAEIAGYASTFDPAPGTGRCPTLRRAIECALADAGTEPTAINVVFADALGTPELDRAEAEAISSVFGPWGVPVTAPKTMTGRLYAGGAALDVAAAALAMRDRIIPPTIGTRTIAPEYEIDLVCGEPRAASIQHALVVARGYGGFNAAMVIRATQKKE
jgi:minimal PKS chain-length factor (CLF/KS beta)